MHQGAVGGSQQKELKLDGDSRDPRNVEDQL